LQEKVDPYLRPLYDALYDLLEQDRVDKMLERNVIEVAPLAFMRGRTLNDAFIIMDEAQNTTSLGSNSKAVITGDVTQIDLPNPKKSGLVEAIEILRGVDGIRFCHFEDGDVVRHHLVQRVIRAYDSFGRAQRELPLNLRESASAKSAANLSRLGGPFRGRRGRLNLTGCPPELGLFVLRAAILR
jgi:phosphate starvation-inducible PhoH-like protein